MSVSLTHDQGAGAGTTEIEGHGADDLDYQRLLWEYRRLREYTEGIEVILSSLPTSVTDWVAGMLKGSPLRSGYEPPVDPE